METKHCLLLGCGFATGRQFQEPHNDANCLFEITTLDINPACCPNVVHDLNVRPLPFGDNTFDIIEAREVLEHIGQQGDYPAFFEEFAEYWRILKPHGVLYACSPAWNTFWAWGDPGHRRIFTEGTIVFLSQSEYAKQLNSGASPMTDYRTLLGNTNFSVTHGYSEDKQTFIFRLEAIK